MGSCNCVEINRTALRHNFEVCHNIVRDNAILAMVKANGYGHGMVECASLFEAMGAAAFGVAETAEGVELRQAGITKPILIFTGVLPEMLDLIVKYALSPVVVDDDCLSMLSSKALALQREIAVHIKVDVGMGRQGCSVCDFSHLFAMVNSLPNLKLAGVLAHFPMSDDCGNKSTGEITKKFFREIVNRCEEDGGGDYYSHVANSGAILYFPETRLDMVRPGLMLYGYYPDGEAGRNRSLYPSLKPVMRFTSRIIQLRDLETGVGLGYGHTAVTSRKTKLALLPVGYADGYLRSMSNKGEVLIRGKRAPVVGRVSMNITMVDVTDIGSVSKDDEVVLLGQQGNEEITADEIAVHMGTINYEVLCLLGNLNNRRYID
ncbi:MAG: alanine racemase [Desulfobulbaceae bacterium]|nr:alanine racemase [Desulfobulbaceae bacterium]